MVAYSALAAGLQAAEFGKITAQDRMTKAANKKLDLLENIADVSKLAESARVKVRNEAKKQVTEAEKQTENGTGKPMSTQDAQFMEYQVIGDDEFTELAVDGDYEEAMEQIDEWKQGILEELQIEEQKIKMEEDAANVDYAKNQQNAEAYKALLNQEIQDFHTYGYTQ